MLRVTFLSLALMLATLASLAVADAKPFREPFHLVRAEQISCGSDCIRDDGVIGQDEAWGWVAEGELTEPFTHTYTTGASGRTALVDVRWKGKGAATITINEVTFTDSWKHRGWNYLSACLDYLPWEEQPEVVISGEARYVVATGSDWMQGIYSCGVLE